MLTSSEYVIVNLWPSDHNQSLNDKNIANVSFHTCIGDHQKYMSIRTGTHQTHKAGFWQKEKPLPRKIFRGLYQRQSTYKQDYDQDCALEGMHQGQVRTISNISECVPGEIPYLVNSANGTLKKLMTQPRSQSLKSEEHIKAIRPVPANIQVVLYSLHVAKINREFKELKESDYPGWSMAGSNLFIRDINRDASENCMSIASACLNSLWPTEATTKISAPRHLLRAIKDAKIRELKHYLADSENCKIADLDETSIEDLVRASNAAEHNLNVKKANARSSNIKFSNAAHNSALVIDQNEVSLEEYEKVRGKLEQLCEGYVAHNESQLNALPKINYALIHVNFSFNNAYPKSGFCGWIANKYIDLMNGILKLRTNFSKAKEDDSLSCFSKNEFFPREDGEINPNYLNERNYVNPELMLDRMNSLYLCLHQIMAHINNEPNFDQRMEEYQRKNCPKYLKVVSNDPLSVKIYKTLMNLRALIAFVNTLPKYNAQGITSLMHYFSELLPTFEGYIKGIGVQELQTLLNDDALNAKEAVQAVALRLENSMTLEILSINRQSKAERILKILSIALIPIGIGIVPTMFLASKRLWETGGRSINFFHPRSNDLYQDATKLTSCVKQSSKAC